VHLSIASPSTRPSPLFRRVGIHIFTFEACSGFTHVTARWIAQPPKAAFVTRLQPGQSPSQTARQLPDQSTTLWVESSSTGETRLRTRRPRKKIVRSVRDASVVRLSQRFPGRPRLSHAVLLEAQAKRGSLFRGQGGSRPRPPSRRVYGTRPRGDVVNGRDANPLVILPGNPYLAGVSKRPLALGERREAFGAHGLFGQNFGWAPPVGSGSPISSGMHLI
jgi:hypothetical protein